MIDIQTLNKEKLITILDNLFKNNFIQNEDGTFPSGRNGPHDDEETSIRTTSHSLISLCFLTINGLEEYRCKASRAIDFLLSKEARPMSGAFFNRKNPEKDFSNGLVGQAWVIESLLYASKTLNRSDCYDLALEVFNQHIWNEKYSAWHLLNVDGSSSSMPHGTFNQQLWFAYVGLLFGQGSKPAELSLKFIDKILPNVEIYSDGVIYHDSVSYNVKINLKSTIKHYLKKIERFLGREKLNKRSHSVGYHAFNCVPLALIRQKCPNNSFFKSNKYKKIVEVITDESFLKEVELSKFGYSYNPSGFECAYFLKDKKDFFNKKQLESMVFNDLQIDFKKTYDKNISFARMYEAVRCFSF
jgi:hypothetical protein